MRHSVIHVRPLVALLGAAFCAGAALAANYTLTNTTVEWPSSNEAENVSGNRFTIVGDVTVVDVGTMAPANLEWTVNASVTGMSVVKTVSPARVAIEVLPAGTFLIFR